MNVLFQGLVRPFGLTIAFRVVARCEVQAHVQCLTERPEEVRDEFGASVGRDVVWNAMLGEHVKGKQFRQLGRSDRIVSRNEHSLF